MQKEYIEKEKVIELFNDFCNHFSVVQGYKIDMIYKINQLPTIKHDPDKESEGI